MSAPPSFSRREEPALCAAAYSSGKPAFGVGPGNVPAFVDTSADVDKAVARIVAGKSFDYGTVCSSEQTLVAEESLRPRILAALERNVPIWRMTRKRMRCARALLMPNWTVNPQCVGQAPQKIARMAGFEIPPDGFHHLCADRRRRQATSALGGKALAGALAVFCEGFQRRSGSLRRAAAVSAAWATRR